MHKETGIMTKKTDTPKSQMERLMAAIRREKSEYQRLARDVSEATRIAQGHDRFTMPEIKVPEITPISEQLREILEPRWEEERKASREAAKRAKRWNIAAFVIAVLALAVSVLGTFGVV